jgi:hypothetical protein
MVNFLFIIEVHYYSFHHTKNKIVNCYVFFQFFEHFFPGCVDRTFFFSVFAFPSVIRVPLSLIHNNTFLLFFLLHKEVKLDVCVYTGYSNGLVLFWLYCKSFYSSFHRSLFDRCFIGYKPKIKITHSSVGQNRKLYCAFANKRHDCSSTQCIFN